MYHNPADEAAIPYSVIDGDQAMLILAVMDPPEAVRLFGEHVNLAKL